MKLIFTKTQKPVTVGMDVVSNSNENFRVVGIQEPHSPASTGRIVVKSVDSKGFSFGEMQGFYPSVFGAEWIDREDRAECSKYDVREVVSISGINSAATRAVVLAKKLVGGSWFYLLQVDAVINGKVFDTLSERIWCSESSINGRWN